MRLGLVLVTAGLVCSMSVQAQARARGGGFFKGGRGAASAPAPQARSGPSVGVGVGVVVPVGSRGERGSARAQQPQRYLLPLPPRPSEEQDGPRIHSVSVEPAAAPKRPWCQDGQVVGRGSGFCEVTLAAERREAPAFFALGN